MTTFKTTQLLRLDFDVDKFADTYLNNLKICIDSIANENNYGNYYWNVLGNKKALLDEIKFCDCEKKIMLEVIQDKLDSVFRFDYKEIGELYDEFSGFANENFEDYVNYGVSDEYIFLNGYFDEVFQHKTQYWIERIEFYQGIGENKEYEAAQKIANYYLEAKFSPHTKIGIKRFEEGRDELFGDGDVEDKQPIWEKKLIEMFGKDKVCMRYNKDKNGKHIFDRMKALCILYVEDYDDVNTENCHYDKCYWGSSKFNKLLKENGLTFDWWDSCVATIVKDENSDEELSWEDKKYTEIIRKSLERDYCKGCNNFTNMDYGCYECEAAKEESD